MRGRTVYRETGRKETRGVRKGERGEKKEGREKGSFRNLLVMGFVYRKSHFICSINNIGNIKFFRYDK
jgi:hypothetical protein